jgi:hypothetical protein
VKVLDKTWWSVVFAEGDQQVLILGCFNLWRFIVQLC